MNVRSCNLWFIKLLICSWIVLWFSDQVRSNNDLTNPALKIKFTNEFQFLLKSDRSLDILKDIAAELGFVYKLHIVAEFYLFIRDDIHKKSENPYDADKIQHAEEILSEYVISIVQDYERTWDDTFLDQLHHKPEYEPHDAVWNDSTSSSIQFSTSGGQAMCGKRDRDVFVAFIDIGFELEHPNLINSTFVSSSVDYGKTSLLYMRSNDGMAPSPSGYSSPQSSTEIFNTSCPNLSLLLSNNFIEGGKDVTPELYSHNVEGQWDNKIYQKLSHGTGCMGRAGAIEGNGCDKGVAPNVKLVGLRAMGIDDSVTDSTEARALSYKWEDIDVFSCSYGIRDNIGFYEPKQATKAALMKGVTKGHECRGVPYIYPSGNGHLDNCNADGYANSIYTITIAQVQKNGHLAGNTEICSAAIAATRGNGYATTQLNGKCSVEFEGSSASCAVAAGFVGELISYRHCLSKRDIEHIMVRTALKNENITWSTNGVGRKYNDQIGFGELDLRRMLNAAINWKYVPQVHTCTIQPKDTEYKHVTGLNWTSKSIIVSNGCRNTSNHVEYLEHVQVEMNLRCSNIFHVAIRLISPSKTVSNILTSMNISKLISKNFKTLHWNFTSVHFWGEQSSGPWIVEVMVENSSVEVECKYNVTKLVLHGTDIDPEKGRDAPLTCEDSNDRPEKSSKSAIATGLILAGILLIFFSSLAVIIVCWRKRNMPESIEPGVAFHNNPTGGDANIQGDPKDQSNNLIESNAG